MSTKPTEALLSPYTLGDLELKNRIVMAPLTRTRAENQGKVPNGLMAARLISEGTGDLVAFGRDYIANPDLAERIRLDAPLNEPRPEYFYGNSAAGYTDYPMLPQSQLIQERSNVK